MGTAQKTQRQQLAEMPKALLRGVSLTLQVLWVPTMVYLGISASPAISSFIETYLNTTQWQLYTLCATGGMVLLCSSAVLENEIEDDPSEDATGEETENGLENDLLEAARMISKGLGAVTYFSLYLIFAVFTGLVVATYISPVFGIAVAVLYPSGEYVFSNRVAGKFTPSGIAIYPALIPILIGTGLIMLAAIGIGVIIGVPFGIIKGLAQVAPSDRISLPFSRNGNGRRPM